MLDAAVQDMLDNNAAKIQARQRCNKQKALYARQRAAAITLTKYSRRGCAVKGFSRQRKGVTAIASLVRMGRSKRMYKQRQVAALKLHAIGRGMLARRCAGERRAFGATLRIQAAIRGRLHRWRYTQQQQASLLIHTAGRRCVGRHRFIRTKQATVLIQACERARAGRVSFVRYRALCIRLQTCCRAATAFHTYLAMRKAAIKGQAWVRCRTQRRSYLRYSACTCIQAWARSCSGCYAFGRARWGCVLLQAAQRRRHSQNDYTTCRLAVVAKQAWVRCHLQRRWYVRYRSSTRLQSTVRKRSAMALLRISLAAAVVIQAVHRKSAAVGCYIVILRAVMRLQTWRRMHGTLPSLHQAPPSPKSPRRPSAASAWVVLQVRKQTHLTLLWLAFRT
jgi:hypothetical protein